MALIKCPECGKDVSTSAEICPHCGYPIQKNLGVLYSDNVNPKKEPNKNNVIIDDSWTKKYYAKRSRVRKIWLIIFILSIIVLAVGLSLIATNIFALWISFVIVGAYCTFGSLIGLIVYLAGAKILIRKYNGHTILVYSALYKILVIDDVEQTKTVLNSNLYGSLPDGKNVWVTHDTKTGNPKIGIGEDHDEKNLI